MNENKENQSSFLSTKPSSAEHMIVENQLLVLTNQQLTECLHTRNIKANGKLFSISMREVAVNMRRQFVLTPLGDLSEKFIGIRENDEYNFYIHIDEPHPEEPFDPLHPFKLKGVPYVISLTPNLS